MDDRKPNPLGGDVYIGGDVAQELLGDDEMVEDACPVCGCEERGQGGYLRCECPAPIARNTK